MFCIDRVLRLAGCIPSGILFLCALSSCYAAPCPQSTNRGSKQQYGVDALITFHNYASVDVELLWVDHLGGENSVGVIKQGAALAQHSKIGHVFNARSGVSSRLMKIYDVNEEDGVVRVEDCEGMGEVKKKELDSSRWPEFEALRHNQDSPCVGPSKDWTCVRSVSLEELSSRDSEKFGFHKDELAGVDYRVGQTTDTKFIGQQKMLVNVTNYEGGYLKMSMTDRMKAVLYPWYEARLKDSMRRHETIPGGFTNNHVVHMDKINLDQHYKVKEVIVSEMKEVLTWWAQQELKHTMTFGMRVYRRGSMLINHLDREDTHVASAVIQVGQRVDEGWPIEVVHPHREGLKEVYLQPGEMVLYEGARIQHGRPKRFEGDEFVNIFSHFVPSSWRGVAHARPNPHYASKPILMKADQRFGSSPRAASLEL